MGYTFSQLIFLILGILYGITTIYSFIRLFYIRKFASDCYLAKYFYVLLVVENVLSGAWFFLLGLFDQLQAATLSDQKQKEEKRLFWSLILVPDALFLITFLILAWQLLKLFVEGHSNTADEIYLPYVRSKEIGGRLLYLALFLYLVLEGIFITLYVLQKVSFYTVSIQLSILNVIIAGIIILSYLALTFVFSGNPYINREYKLKTKVVSWVVLIWSFLKIFKGTAGIIQDENLIESIELIDVISSSNHILLNIAFLVMFLIWDILPVLIVLDSSILNAFTIEARRLDHYSMLECQLLLSHYNEDEESASPAPFTKDLEMNTNTMSMNSKSPLPTSPGN